MTISRDKFIAAGRAVYGGTWKSALAEKLGVSRQQVHRWANGEAPIPEYAARRLLADHFALSSAVWDLGHSIGVKLPRRPPVPEMLKAITE